MGCNRIGGGVNFIFVQIAKCICSNYRMYLSKSKCLTLASRRCLYGCDRRGGGVNMEVAMGRTQPRGCSTSIDQK